MTIEIKNLTIGYSRKGSVKTVARHMSASINHGELTCLLGVNGIGKSTLLRTLSAFQPKLKGEIRIQGKEITHYTAKELSHLIGVVLTDRLDIYNMTAREIVGLGRSPYTGFWGGLDSEDEIIIDRSINQVGIEKLSQRMIHTLSDGERQKVLIAKVLAQETPIIFLDEPTAFLDFPSKVEIMQLLHRLSRDAKKTIFLSTHDLELALQIADKLWIMNGQDGLTVGTPEDLSLSGSLNNFFSSKDVIFDIETGLFRVNNTFTREIRLEGEGQRYAMARKALMRNGILADREVVSDFYVKADDKGFHVYLPSKTELSVVTIEELLSVIERYLVH